MENAKKEKAENYTAAMVEKIKAAAPLTYDKAEALAKDMGKSVRSIIAKAKRENIEYTPKPPALKKPQGVTKKDIVENVAAVLNLSDVEKIADLSKASTAALNTLLSAIVALAPVVDDAEADDAEADDAEADDAGYTESAEFTDDAEVDDAAQIE